MKLSRQGPAYPPQGHPPNCWHSLDTLAALVLSEVQHGCETRTVDPTAQIISGEP